MTEENLEATEKAEGFDRSAAEDAIQEYLTRRLGGGAPVFESSTPGVVAIERLGIYDAEKIDFAVMARFLSERVGVPVAAVDDCDWSFPDRHDEEATFFAFGIPSLDPDYAERGRDLAVAPAGPATAPAP